MVTVMLMLQRKGQSVWQGMGERRFAVLPRIGDGVELEVAGEGRLFRVVGFHHPAEPTSTAGDLFVVEEGPTSDVIARMALG